MIKQITVADLANLKRPVRIHADTPGMILTLSAFATGAKNLFHVSSNLRGAYGLQVFAKGTDRVNVLAKDLNR